jgi:hypothetical protein
MIIVTSNLEPYQKETKSGRHPRDRPRNSNQQSFTENFELPEVLSINYSFLIYKINIQLHISLSNSHSHSHSYSITNSLFNIQLHVSIISSVVSLQICAEDWTLTQLQYSIAIALCNVPSPCHMDESFIDDATAQAQATHPRGTIHKKSHFWSISPSKRMVADRVKRHRA